MKAVTDGCHGTGADAFVIVSSETHFNRQDSKWRIGVDHNLKCFNHQLADDHVAQSAELISLLAAAPRFEPLLCSPFAPGWDVL